MEEWRTSSIHTLTSAMMGWSASSPGCFTVGESVSTSHHTGDCRTDTRTGPDAPYKKNLLLMPGPAPSPPSTNYYYTIQAQQRHQPTRPWQWTSSDVDGIFREPSNTVLTNCP